MDRAIAAAISHGDSLSVKAGKTLKRVIPRRFFETMAEIVDFSNSVPRPYKPLPQRLIPFASFLYIYVSTYKPVVKTWFRMHVRRHVTTRVLTVHPEVLTALSLLLKNVDISDVIEEQRGGDLLGKGKEGTLVYSLDDLYMNIATGDSACLLSFAKTPSCTDIHTLVQRQEDITKIAVKQIKSASESMMELKTSDEIYPMFKRHGRLKFTAFHPKYKSLKVVSRGREDSPFTCPVYKRFTGSAHNGLQIVDEDMLYNMTRNTLACISVLHMYNRVHMDIKPENIFYEIRNGKYNFVLGDYDVVEKMDNIFKYLREGHDFEQGTDGYMSPILWQDIHAGEKQNLVFDRFTKVAHITGEMPLVSTMNTYEERDSFWCEHFEAFRTNMPDCTYIAKIDLQSAGLCIYDMIPRDARHIMLSDKSSFLHHLLPKLMFAREDDFVSAEVALMFMCRLRRTRKMNNNVSAKRCLTSP